MKPTPDLIDIRSTSPGMKDAQGRTQPPHYVFNLCSLCTERAKGTGVKQRSAYGRP
jgi:hypothetical protein